MKLKLFKRDEMFEVMPDDILYLKAEGHYTKLFFSKDTKILLPFGLSQVFEELTRLKYGTCFTKLGRSYIINRNRVVYASVIKEYFTMLDRNNNFTSIKVSKNTVKRLMMILKDGAKDSVLSVVDCADEEIQLGAKLSGGGKNCIMI